MNIPLPPGTGDEGMLMALEEVVLPILEDWRPNLVINAAGQDNHFSDPITNMGFSAQGYAKLTDLLQPDIVVLEGGYSIESALPYINVGLLLAWRLGLLPGGGTWRPAQADPEQGDYHAG